MAHALRRQDVGAWGFLDGAANDNRPVSRARWRVPIFTRTRATISQRGSPTTGLVSNSGSGTGNNVSISSLPSGLASGDVAILVINCYDSSSTTFTTPTGWTQVNNSTSPSTTRLGIWIRVCDGTETSFTVTGTRTTFSTATSTWSVIAYSGVDNTTPQDAAATNTTTSSSTSISVASITTVTDNALLLAILGANGSGGSLYVTATAPSGMTERVDYNGTTQYSHTYICDQTITSAGATGSKTITTDNAESGRVVTMALRPALTPLNGAASITLAAVTTSAAGTVAVQGSASITISAETVSAAGTVALAGAAAITLGAETTSAAGTVSLSGAAGPTLDGIATSASGAVALTGAAADTLADISVSTAGAVALVGSASIAVDGLAISAAGVEAISGASGVTVDATSSGAGVISVTGSGAITTDGLTLAAAGILTIAGAASVTAGPTSLSAAGAIAISGASAPTLDAIVLTADGIAATRAQGAVTLAALTVSAAGTVATSGAASINLGALGLVASAELVAIPTSPNLGETLIGRASDDNIYGVSSGVSLGGTWAPKGLNGRSGRATLIGRSSKGTVH